MYFMLELQSKNTIYILLEYFVYIRLLSLGKYAAISSAVPTSVSVAYSPTE